MRTYTLRYSDGLAALAHAAAQSDDQHAAVDATSEDMWKNYAIEVGVPVLFTNLMPYWPEEHTHDRDEWEQIRDDIATSVVSANHLMGEIELNFDPLMDPDRAREICIWLTDQAQNTWYHHRD